MMRVGPRLKRGGATRSPPVPVVPVPAFRVAQRRVTGSSTPPEKQVRDASHRHGVSKITKGERYTMPMWFTDDLGKAATNIGRVY